MTGIKFSDFLKNISDETRKISSDTVVSEQLKPYKTVEEIAKKHKVSVDKINQQLKIGIKVEKEHTKNSSLAKKIALQHLDEIPNYYDLLKKVEKKN